ncbi:unnamed protein product [Ilex paraguariensis]|uniref:NAC domain-containing protein n=1 Tax=Ilex paraguariensis TaxID=185542 RepID=A0ABC8TWT0_9AQUA
MEMSNSFRYIGGMKLPIGFRFHPTDEELVVHYLNRKVCSLPLPASVIPELDVYQTNPWDLPGDSEEKMYFFSKRRGNVKRCGTTTFISGSGYWKAIGKDKQILTPGSSQPVGIKKSLVFYQLGIGRRPRCPRPRGFKTRWVMHEYCLVGSGTTPHYSTQKLMMQMGDWVVCRIYQKKRKAKKDGVKTQYWNGSMNTADMLIRPSNSIIDLLMEDSTDELGPPQPSASWSSGITEVSSDHDDQLDDEESSSAAIR